MKKTLILILLLAYSFVSYAQESSNPEPREIKDLLYVDASSVENDSLQRLHLVLPGEGKDFPLLIWIGGGAWSYVNRHVELDLARTFASEGIAVACVGHRLSSAIWKDPSLSEGIQHPKHIEDIAAAVKYLYDEAGTHRFDREKIFVGGFSSGAHLAALLGLDERYLQKHGLSRENIKGMIPISGAYDIVNYYEVFKNGSRPHLAEQHVQAVFGESQEAMIDASPTHYVENLSIPILMLTDQGIVNYTRIFEDKIREKDFHELTVVYAHNLSHAALWRDISLNEHSMYRSIMRDFIYNRIKQLKAGG